MGTTLSQQIWYSRLLRVALWFCYAAGIFYLSSKPWPQASNLPEGSDKVIHFTIYALFAIETLWVLRLTRLRHQKINLELAAALIVSLYGASDEVHQLFVPGRSSSIFDWMADTTGGFAGAYVAWKLAEWKERKYAS